MKDRKRQLDRQNEWIQKNRSRLSVTTTKDNAERIRTAADRESLSVNAFVLNAIDYYIESDPNANDNTIIESDPDTIIKYKL